MDWHSAQHEEPRPRPVPSDQEVVSNLVLAVSAASISAYWASGGSLLAIVGGVGAGALVWLGWVLVRMWGRTK